MAAGPGTRAMRLLAVRVIERRDREAALVLGDAMMEHGIDGIVTGRSRPVRFRTRWPHAAHVNDLRQGRVDGAIVTAAEAAAILRVRTEEPTFFQQAREVVYNIPQFASRPTEESWRRIWSMWVTPWRGTYRALVAARILPATMRFMEIRHTGYVHRSFDEDTLLAYRLSLHRVPRRRKRVATPWPWLFDIERRVSDNPRTDGVHFKDDGPQLPLFGGDARRSRR